jgi:DNA-binding MarR family transcriptional regulator
LGFGPKKRILFSVRALSPPLTKADYEALAGFRYHLRRFLHQSESLARDAGLTPRQHQALLAIRGFPGRDQITIGELAEQLQVAHHSAVELVDRLVGLGFLLRKPAAEDRRQVYVALTRAGEKRLEQLSQAHRSEIESLGPRFLTLLERIAMPDSVRR